MLLAFNYDSFLLHFMGSLVAMVLEWEKTCSESGKCILYKRVIQLYGERYIVFCY